MEIYKKKLISLWPKFNILVSIKSSAYSTDQTKSTMQSYLNNLNLDLFIHQWIIYLLCSAANKSSILNDYVKQVFEVSLRLTRELPLIFVYVKKEIKCTGYNDPWMHYFLTLTIINCDFLVKPWDHKLRQCK